MRDDSDISKKPRVRNIVKKDTVAARPDLSGEMKPNDGTRRITLPERDLEITQIAPRARALPTLVFLHEGIGSIALWKDFPAALAERTRCGATIYSRHGNGRSSVLSRPRDLRYMHDEALQVLPHLLTELGIDEPILIGHSDGASIALIYAGEHPHGVGALVLESPHVFVEELGAEHRCHQG